MAEALRPKKGRQKESFLSASPVAINIMPKIIGQNAYNIGIYVMMLQSNILYYILLISTHLPEQKEISLDEHYRNQDIFSSSGRDKRGNVGSDDTGEFKKCMDRDKIGNTGIIIECSQDESERQDYTIDQEYVAIESLLSAAQKRRFQQRQRRWVVARDRRCDAQLKRNGGWEYSLNRVMWYGCQMHERGLRIAWLKRYARRMAAGK